MIKIMKKTFIITIALFMCVLQFQFAINTNNKALAASSNLALNKSVTYSDVEGGKKGDNTWTYPQFAGESAVDGNATTRWSAGKTDVQWLTVDLGEVYNLREVSISFHAEAPEYEVLISADGLSFTSIAKISDGSNGKTVNKSFDLEGKSARYVKYEQQKMWKHTNNQFYGSSIYELSVAEYDETEISDDTLRIGTFNIAAGTKPNVEAQSKLTKDYNLEIVGLQEVDKFTTRNNYDMLEKFAGSNYPASYFSKAINAVGGEYGIGTVSLYPLQDSTTTFVDTTGASEKRVFQRSVIEKKGRKIAFYNTHLSYETPAIRERQFKQLKEAIQNDPTEYKVVVGDFNADQYRSEFNTFLETMDMVNGYEDVWYDTFNGVDSTMKVNSIDNILVSRNLNIDKIELVKTTLSDHHLLTAEVSFLDEAQVSKEWLRASLLDAEVIEKTNYTNESYQALQDQIQLAKDAINREVTQIEVDNTTKALLKAIDDLELFNLAYRKAVTYSGVEGGKKGDGTWTYPQFVGENVVDGNSATRWSAAKEDSQWLTVDLGELMDISEILIYFHAQSPDYEIQVSKDNINYEQIFHEPNGENGGITVTKQISFPSTKARYVKYVQNKQFTLASNGNKYGSSIIEFEVYKEFKIEDIKIENETNAISKGDEFEIKTTILPALASHKKLSYTSSDETVAKVNASGKVTALKEGNTTITIADATNPTLFKTMEIQVFDGPIKVSKFIFNPETISLTKRDKRFLEYNVYPSNASNHDVAVEWKSSDESIATVSKNGVLESKGVGSAIISVSSKENPSIKGELQVTIAEPNYVEDYDIMQDRWLRRVVGDDDLNTNDNDIAAYIENIDEEAKELWKTLDKNKNRTFLWERVSSDTVAADYTTQFTKIKKLALGFGVKGSSLYQNRELHNDIVEAINFMVVNKRYDGSYSTGNWWDWQIGVTHPLVDTLMILKDYTGYEKIAPAIKSVEGYASSPNKQWPNTTSSGANRTDIGLAVLGSAIVAHNDGRMELVKAQIPDVMKMVTSGDGLYKDGSLIQHSNHAYTGSYGNELLKGVGKIQSIVANTKWEITDERVGNVYNTISKGYLPLVHKGQMMSMVNGRSISRAPGTNPFTTDFEAGAETISNIMLIAQFAPEPYKTEYLSALKYWLKESKDNFDFFGHARDFESLLNAKSILNDETIAEKTYRGMSVYGSMDRVVQVKEAYSIGLSMYSSRIANYESINGENKKGWHTSDGALYLYNNDLKQYGEGFWATIDPYRLPGTTVDTRALADGVAQSRTAPQSWVGGATDGENGIAGMYLNKSNLSIGMDLKAQKSWFFLDDKIVALGSNINGTTPNSIETIIENRMLTGDNKISINDEDWNKNSETKNLEAGSYAHLSGTGKSNDIGYYFPATQDIELVKELRQGKYENINSIFVNDKTYENTFFKMGMNHGKNVENANYEYILLPGYSKTEVKKFANENTIKVIKNTGDVQAIKDDKKGIFAMNVWPEAGTTLEGMSINNSASIYTETKDGVMNVSISNPKQNAVKLTFTLEAGYKSVLSKSDKVSVNSDGSFTIDTTGSAGATHTIAIELKVDKAKLEDAITEAEGIEETAYTPASWQALQDAINSAKAIVTDVDATYAQVQAGIDALNNAKENLVTKANKEILQDLVTSIDELAEADYTEASWNDLQSELQKAQGILIDENVSQTIVDSAVIELQDAIDHLVSSDPDVEYRILKSADESIIVSGMLHADVDLDGSKYDSVKDTVNKVKDKKIFDEYIMEEVYKIDLFQAGTKYQPVGLMKVQIKVNKELEGKTIRIAYVDEEGGIEQITSKVEDGYLVFETTHFSDYSILSVIETTTVAGSTNGTNTGDSTNIKVLLMLSTMALLTIGVFVKRRSKKE